MKVELIDFMGSDLTVINSARVSFDKNKTVFDDKDEKLISYLAKNNHWSPFSHCFLQFRITAPIFVARQLVKHQVGLAWNEVSRRYVDSNPEFYRPEGWRLKAENKKQGSSEETIKFNIDEVLNKCTEVYQVMLSKGIAPEMARMILPQNLYTSWYWSGSLFAFARVCNLRCDSHSQKETQYIANKIDAISVSKFPVSWKHLRKNN